MIGKYIASRRKELRISQKALAEKLNVTAGAVSQWEHGRTMPDIPMYPKIADALNTTVASLFGEQQKKEPAVDLSGFDPDLVEAMRDVRPEEKAAVLALISGLKASRKE